MDYQIGDKITLFQFFSEDHNKYAFKLTGVLPRGRSCEAYDAVEEGKGLSVRLKHFAPLCSAPGSDDYKEGSERFICACNTQADLLAAPETGNAVAALFGLFKDDKGGLWSAVQLRHGTLLADVRFDSLYDLLKAIHSLGEQVKALHNKGFLVLDLSEKNILVLAGGAVNGIQLFDFDSLLRLEDLNNLLTNGGSIAISSTPGIGAPELSRIGIDGEGLEEIGIEADFYSLGSILFMKIMGRRPTVEEIYYRETDWSEITLPQNESKHSLDLAVIEKLRLFFKYTITSSPYNRYAKDDDLLEALRDLLNAASPARPHSFVTNEIGMGPSTPYYVRQDNELHELASYFAEKAGQNAVAVIVGDVSGVGKTELARQFAKESLAGNLYDAVEFTVFHEGKGFDGILDQCAFQGEDQDKKKALLEGNQRVLLIIDNYDQEHALPLPPMANVHLLLTTRYNTSGFDGAKYIPLNSSREFGLEIFESVYQGMGKLLSARQKELADKMLDMVEYHPFFADMAARELAEYYPSEQGFGNFLKRMMKEEGLPAGGAIEARKDKRYGEKSDRGNMQAFVESLFSDLFFHDLNKIEEYVLDLLGISGMKVSENTVCVWIGDCVESGQFLAKEAVKRLIDRHFIKKANSDTGDSYIYFHPLVWRLFKKLGIAKANERENHDVFAINILAQDPNFYQFDPRTFDMFYLRSGLKGFRELLDEYKAKNQLECQQNDDHFLHNKLSLIMFHVFKHYEIEPVSLKKAFLYRVNKMYNCEHKSWLICRARIKTGNANLYFIVIPAAKRLEPLLKCESGYEYATEKSTAFNGAEIKNCANISILMFSFSDSIESAHFNFNNVLPPIVSIENLEMLSSSTLKTVSLPDTTTDIGMHAFSACIRLSEITIPDSVSFIAKDAFDGCTSLRAVHASPEWKEAHKDFLASLPAYDPEA